MPRLKNCGSVVIALLAATLAFPAVAIGQAGVLLGYTPIGDTASASYGTLLIVFSPTEVKVAAASSQLILPRADGFWRLGNASACTPVDDEVRQDTLWQRPVSAPPLADDTAPCGGKDAQTFCDVHDASYLAVFPQFISTHSTFSQTSACEDRGGRFTTISTVNRFGSTEDIPFPALLGPQGDSLYAEATHRGYLELSKDMNCPDPEDDEVDLTQWSIRHIKGRWMAFAEFNGRWGDCGYNAQVNRPLPRSVTGVTQPAINWAGSARVIPDLRDIYPSPAGDYAVVLTMKPGELHLYRFTLKAGIPDRKLGELPWLEGGSPGPRIVMAEWATGRFVSGWTDQILKLAHPRP
jgi:hypothetical protein